MSNRVSGVIVERLMSSNLKFESVQLPYAINEHSVFSWQIGRIGKISWRLMIVFVKIFEDIVERGVLMVVGR